MTMANSNARRFGKMTSKNQCLLGASSAQEGAPSNIRLRMIATKVR
jgi:hypothetical protein